jgi:hypothetical protein
MYTDSDAHICPETRVSQMTEACKGSELFSLFAIIKPHGGGSPGNVDPVNNMDYDNTSTA